MKSFLSALLATLLVVTAGFGGGVAQGERRLHAPDVCHAAGHRTRGGEPGTTGGTNIPRDAAIEAAVPAAVGINGLSGRTPNTNPAVSARQASTGDAGAGPAFTRPHDPLHLHPYSLLI